MAWHRGPPPLTAAAFACHCCGSLAPAYYAEIGPVFTRPMTSDRPPHRSVLALLAHTALILDAWRRNEHSGKDARCGDRAPSGRTSSNSVPTPFACHCGGLRSSTTARTDDAGIARAWRCCPGPHGIGSSRAVHVRASRRLAPTVRASGGGVPA